MVESRIEYSPTGKPAHRQLWANVEGPAASDVRRSAARLLVDLEQTYPHPAVWLDGARLSASASDVERERRRLAAYRESGDIQAA